MVPGAVLGGCGADDREPAVETAPDRTPRSPGGAGGSGAQTRSASRASLEGGIFRLRAMGRRVAGAYRAPMATTLKPARPFRGAGEYPLEAGNFDEAFAATGAPRRPYAELLGALARQDPSTLRERVGPTSPPPGSGWARAGDHGRSGAAADRGRRVGATGARAAATGAGVERFVADAYGAQRIFEAGVVPRRLLKTSEGFEPVMGACSTPRCRRRPSPGSTSSATRAASCGSWRTTCGCPPGLLRDRGPRSRRAGDRGAAAAAPPRRLHREAARGDPAAAPPGRDEPAVAILSDGPENGTWYEHERLGRELELPVLTPRPARDQPGRLFARRGRAREQIDVIYRRLDEERLCGPTGRRPTSGGYCAGVAVGQARCANAFGTGVGDDKLAHAYVERMIEFYLGEEPLLRSVPSYDLAVEADLEAARAAGRAGDQAARRVRRRGVTIMPRARAAAPARDRRCARARALHRPGDGGALHPPDRGRRRPGAAAGRPAPVRGRAPARRRGDDRRPDPLRARGRRDGRQQLAGRRRQGHVGARGAAMKRRS